MKELNELRNRLNSSISTEFEIVTPELAKGWLRTSMGNRVIKSVNIKMLEKAINEGDWDPCSSPISFDKDGHLFDGHHRLHAVINTGKSIVSMISRGWDPSVKYVIDTGSARSMADQFTIYEIPNSSTVSTIVAAVKLLEANYKISDDAGMGYRVKKIGISPKECLSEYYKYSDIYQFAGRIGARIRSRLRGVFTVKEIGMHVAYIMLHCNVSFPQAEEFWENIMSMDGMYGSLRNKFIREISLDRKEKMSAYERLSCIAQVWNAYHKGSTIGKIIAQQNEIRFV